MSYWLWWLSDDILRYAVLSFFLKTSPKLQRFFQGCIADGLCPAHIANLSISIGTKMGISQHAVFAEATTPSPDDNLPAYHNIYSHFAAVAYTKNPLKGYTVHRLFDKHIF